MLADIAAMSAGSKASEGSLPGLVGEEQHQHRSSLAGRARLQELEQRNLLLVVRPLRHITVKAGNDAGVQSPTDRSRLLRDACIVPGFFLEASLGPAAALAFVPASLFPSVDRNHSSAQPM